MRTRRRFIGESGLALAAATLGLETEAGAEGDLPRMRRSVTRPLVAEQPFPLCDQRPFLYQNIVSADPEVQLSVDGFSFERPSDWRGYEPLATKAHELARGASAFDAAHAIGHWVRNSRPYGVNRNSVSSVPPSVIEIFHSDHGVCWDASVLLSAMLTLAGIPAYSVMTINRTHFATRFHAESKWRVMDATFSKQGEWPPGIHDPDGSLYDPDGSFPLPTLYAYSPRWFAGVVNPSPDDSAAGCPSPIIYDDLILLSTLSDQNARREFERFGIRLERLRFPVSAKTLWTDLGRGLLGTSPLPDAQKDWVTPLLEPIDPAILAHIPSYGEPLMVTDPFIHWRAIHRCVPGGIAWGQRHATGYLELLLPAGAEYRLSYAPRFFPNDDSERRRLCCAEFRLDAATTIRPGMLERPIGGWRNAHNHGVIRDSLDSFPGPEYLPLRLV